MGTMNIDLPDSMKRFVQERMIEGGYESASEYPRDLIRADQRRQTQARVDAVLLEGLDSGEPVTASDDYWEQKKRRLVERLGEAHRPQ